MSPARSFVEGRLKLLSVVWIAGPCVCTLIYPPRARNCSANNIEEMEDCCALCTSCKQAIYLSDELVPVCQSLFVFFLSTCIGLCTHHAVERLTPFGALQALLFIRSVQHLLPLGLQLLTAQRGS